MEFNSAHMYWYLIGSAISFLIPAIFGNSKKIPRDLYYLIYFLIIGSFLIFYIRQADINAIEWLNNNLLITALTTILFSVLVVKNVLSRPATEKLKGSQLTLALFWRGLIYGTVDGLLLSVFPLLITWNIFSGIGESFLQKLGFAAIVYLLVITISTIYHLGYIDFRSGKVSKAVLGNVVISTPMLLSFNPVCAPIAHAAMHIAAILHSPKTDLFLPPHS